MLESLEQSEENYNKTSQDDDAEDFVSDHVQDPVENEVPIEATQMSSNIGQSSGEGSRIPPLPIMPGAPIFSQNYGIWFVPATDDHGTRVFGPADDLESGYTSIYDGVRPEDYMSRMQEEADFVINEQIATINKSFNRLSLAGRNSAPERRASA
ncbi:hypothetical protein L202_07587 [Cryptococcus amylolentus CBS 6039]|uniref:Uncharacterized protein n=1 Tax=Cryptococcus amylolentus CBS 6039 TaxID=1295533 RepID=A0A1E3HCT1_9TREE|nr:hypothetical protein L202_07587 [Cryptococcus amylolentus CBS 6039]ODN74134.1 hypothetical protein L202_07587 [Cryptococcus amylolentus CBS 6039]